jgi:unspecific monooxygenase
MGLRQSLLWLRNPYHYLDEAMARHGLTFRARLPVVGPCLFTGDPNLVMQIEQDPALVGGRGTTALLPVVGKGSLIVLEGARHEKHRRIFAPPFFAGRMDVEQGTREWTLRSVDRLRVGEQTTAMALISGVTLNVIVEVVFGKLPEARHRRAVALIESWMRSFDAPLVLFVRALHLDLGPSSPWGRFRRNRDAVVRFVREELAARAADPGLGLLGHALRRAAAGEALDEDELVSECITFLLFGHDTTAAAMAWVLYHLGLHPEVRAQLREEARGAGPDLRPCRRARAVIDESMRLTPVVVHLTRHADRATRVGPYAVRQNERVLPSAYIAHRNPAVFEEPSRFLPERFLGGRDYRHAYFPFGLGARLCAGMPFALRQMEIMTSLLAAHIDYELVDAAHIRPARKMVLMVPSGGTRLRRTQ